MARLATGIKLIIAGLALAAAEQKCKENESLMCCDKVDGREPHCLGKSNTGMWH